MYNIPNQYYNPSPNYNQFQNQAYVNNPPSQSTYVTYCKILAWPPIERVELFTA